MNLISCNPSILLKVSLVSSISSWDKSSFKYTLICTWDSKVSAILFKFKMTIEKKPKINKERTTVKMEAKVIQMLRLKEV